MPLLRPLGRIKGCPIATGRFCLFREPDGGGPSPAPPAMWIESAPTILPKRKLTRKRSRFLQDFSAGKLHGSAGCSAIESALREPGPAATHHKQRPRRYSPVEPRKTAA